jgi:osmoprotectant transport system ATP-binding protein
MSSVQQAGARTNGEAKIRLENLEKRFPGQSEPAVAELTMEIPEGEIIIFVGPSGCGKTTTMKMINRIIEPTSGRIILDGEDVTNVDPDQLRRRIGYVIQQIGLFPHQTIAENIATVPRLLGWDKKRIRRAGGRAAGDRQHGPRPVSRPLSQGAVRRSATARWRRPGDER